MVVACRKTENKQNGITTTTTASGTSYDFSWAYRSGIPDYAHLYSFTFTTTAPASSTCVWDFGDGSTATAPAPVHDYSAIATYRVTLTVDGDTAHRTIKYLNIRASIPHTFDYSGTVLPDTTLHFFSNVLPDSSFYWEFGDGTTSTDSMPNHAYAAAGSYTVRLTINGRAASAVTRAVTIFSDPGYTSYIGGVRSWHDTNFLYRSTPSITPYPRPDSSFALTCINPIKVGFGSAVLTYNPYGSTDSVLNYGISSVDIYSNTHTVNVYFNHVMNSIKIEKYDRISAGGYTNEVWTTY
jgi:PKD repeat protein